MDEKRSKRLCFFCDEKYVLAHNCRDKKQLYLVEVLEEETLELNDKKKGQELTDAVDEFIVISLQAYTSVIGCQTIIVTGYHVKKPL